MNLRSEEINKLIYNYLKESNYNHSLYMFKNESGLKEKDTSDVIPEHGLLNLIYKGMKYAKIERHINSDGTETQCDAPFELNKSHQCTTEKVTRLAYYVDNSDSKIERAKSIKLHKQTFKLSHIRFHLQDIILLKMFKNHSNCLLITGGLDTKIRAWDVKKIKEHYSSLEFRKQFENHSEIPNIPGLNEKIAIPFLTNTMHPSKGTICCGAFDSSGKKFAVGRANGIIDIYEYSNVEQPVFKHLNSLTPDETSLITSLTWEELPDNNKLLVSHMNGNLRMWDIKTNRIVNSFSIHTESILNVECQKENATFITSDSQGVIRYFGFLSKTPIRTIRGHSSDINGAKIFHKGKCVLSWSDDGTIKVWGLDSKNLNNLKEEICGPNTSKNKNKNTNERNESKDINNPYLIKTYNEHISEVTFVDILDDESGFISVSNDYTLKIWDFKKDNSIYTFKEHAHPITALKYISSKKIIATGNYGCLSLFDSKTRKTICKIKMKGNVTDLIDHEGLLFGVCGNTLFVLEY